MNSGWEISANLGRHTRMGGDANGWLWEITRGPDGNSWLLQEVTTRPPGWQWQDGRPTSLSQRRDAISADSHRQDWVAGPQLTASRS